MRDKFETSQVGALINAALGKTEENENFDLIRGYNDLNIGIGGPVLGIPKLSFWISGQYLRFIHASYVVEHY